MNTRKTVEVIFDGSVKSSANDSKVKIDISVGHLHFQPSSHGGIFSFEYSKDWLNNNLAFDLDPGISLGNGLTYSGGSNFGIFLDSSPDRWGRTLMERREAESAAKEGRRTRSLTEFDFLMGVNDETRMGCLRFKDPATGEFLSVGSGAIPCTSLAEIMDIARHVEERREHSWLSLLVAPGSSLGGARPKTNYIEEDGSLWIAKFPSREDRYDVAGFEMLAAKLARMSGIDVPESKLIDLGDSRHRTFCIKRFDRSEGGRRFYMSAMTAGGLSDNEGGSYLDIAGVIMDHAAKDKADLQMVELYRRMVFSALIGNIDDHLRNHGFIAEDSGLVLSPAFDMNPSTARIAHAITFDGYQSIPDMQAILEVAPYFRLDMKQAMHVIENTADVVSKWMDVGKSIGIDRHDLLLMAPAFGALDHVKEIELPKRSRKP